MKFLFTILTIFCSTLCIAQYVVNPVFDRADTPSFRVKKIEITSDTTYVHCLYYAEENSWANISSCTYVEDVSSGSKYPIIEAVGIPFNPDKRNFSESEIIEVVLSFPQISAKKINIIENKDDNESFNIYGIDFNKSYETSYTESDVDFYRNLAVQKENENDWNAAIGYTMKQLDASKFVSGIHSKEAAFVMFNLTMEYSEIEDYDKMIEWGKNAIEILGVLPPDSIALNVLARAYGNIGTAYIAKKNETGFQYMEHSLATRKMLSGISTLDYEEYLIRLANNYYYWENYPKALLYGKEIVSIYEKKYKEDNSEYGCVYIQSLNNLCGFYMGMHQFDEAINVARKALELIDNGVCEDVSWWKFAVCTNLAAALASTGQVDEGIAYIENIINEYQDGQSVDNRFLINSKMLLAEMQLDNKQDTIKAIHEYESILKIIEDSIAVGKQLYPAYTEILHKLHKVYTYRDRNTGLRYLKKAVQAQKEWTGDKSIAYANVLLKYVDSAFLWNLVEGKSTDSLYLYLRTSFEIIKRFYNNSIYTMSKTERSDYWERYKRIFTQRIPTFSGLAQTGEWNSLAYDASLFYKGVLLSSEIELKKVVQASADSTLSDLYLGYIRDLSLLEEQCSMKYVSIDADSLKSEIKEKEFLLSQKISRFGMQYKGTNFSWKEVKDKLGEDDVAIEIVSYESLDGSTMYYDAYVINNTLGAPMQIFLFNETTLKELVRPDSIDYIGLSSLIWGNETLSDIIKEKKNIYFSTSGTLNTIGIEYLPISRKSNISDKYNLYRLSSTRMLCVENDSTPIMNACLYGGLDYNYMETKQSKVSNSVSKLSRSFLESLVLRGDFDPLIGSKQEIEQIKLEMVNKSLNCIAYIGTEGTEDSFKDMSGSQINIIHLSTHGMYFPYDSNDLGDNNFSFIISDETDGASYIDTENRTLTRSFLVMSGGNRLIHRDSIPIGTNDGILTALEISHLDFSNLDLVVLSACQTALGAIESEGVYGLQRGFKKAGANTILMSLDKVDDEATKILMVEFYKNLMSGKTKHQSLKEAQKYLRRVANGKYDNPKYWASFIMLDGLN